MIGVADARLGEVGMAFVVTGTPGLSGIDVIGWCRGQMANYKVPRRWNSSMPCRQRNRKGAERRPAPTGRRPLVGEGVAPAESGLSTLSDLRVIELGVWVAAPSAAALLADWGADV